MTETSEPRRRRRVIVPLTKADLSRLTRAELLDRIEAEQAYWHNRQDRGRFAADDREAFKQFGEIMNEALSPAAAISDLRQYVEGTPGSGGYWNEAPRG